MEIAYKFSLGEYYIDPSLSANTQNEIKRLLNNIKSENIDNEIVIQCLAPCISYIARRMIEPEAQLGSPSTRRKLIKIFEYIEVEDIILDLTDFIESFVPVAKKYLAFLDAQAEMIMLFCNNYIYKFLELNQ